MRIAKQSTPAMVKLAHCRKSNALLDKSVLVNFWSRAREFGPATPSTLVLSVTLFMVTSKFMTSRCVSSHLQFKPLLMSFKVERAFLGISARGMYRSSWSSEPDPVKQRNLFGST